MVLHRLTKNGQCGSDRPNNILKVKKLDKFQDEKVLTARASDGKEVVIVRSRTVDIFDKSVAPKVESSSEENFKIDESTSDNDWKNLNISARKGRTAKFVSVNVFHNGNSRRYNQGSRRFDNQQKNPLPKATLSRTIKQNQSRPLGLLR